VAEAFFPCLEVTICNIMLRDIVINQQLKISWCVSATLPSQVHFSNMKEGQKYGRQKALLRAVFSIVFRYLRIRPTLLIPYILFYTGSVDRIRFSMRPVYIDLNTYGTGPYTSI
jgi:hypothetical protein